MHRLRGRLGAGALLLRPCRLPAAARGECSRWRRSGRGGAVGGVAAGESDGGGDSAAVRKALRGGAGGAVAPGSRGGLLPRSEAPVVCEEREDLVAGVRRAVIRRGDAESLWEFTRTPDGSGDAEALRQ